MELVDKIDMDNKMFKWPGRLSNSPPAQKREKRKKKKKNINGGLTSVS